MTSNAKLRDLPLSEILKLYNEAAVRLGRPEVKRFSDRNTAIKRTNTILSEHTTKAQPEFKLEPTKSRRSRGFNFPVKSDIKKMRRGTLREHLRDFLVEGEGVTFEQVVAAVSAYDKTQGVEPYNLETRPYEALRLLHLYCGYGLREDEAGKIYLLGHSGAA